MTDLVKQAHAARMAVVSSPFAELRYGPHPKAYSDLVDSKLLEQPGEQNHVEMVEVGRRLLEHRPSVRSLNWMSDKTSPMRLAMWNGWLRRWTREDRTSRVS